MNPKLDQALDAIHDIAVEAGISFCFVAEAEGSMLVSAKVTQEPEFPILHLVSTLLQGEEGKLNPRAVIGWLIKHYPKTMSDFIDEIGQIDSMMHSNHGVTQ